ncbi:MAG: hypothetical protein ACYCW9_00675 [Thermoplasmata archaeon]
MVRTSPGRRVASIAFLQRSRALLRIPGGWVLAASIAVGYGLVAMFFGGMIVLGTVRSQYGLFVLWGSGTGQAPWNYPGLLLVAPWGVVTLPFFATIAMVVVSAGVGLGMGVAVLLTLRLLKNRRSDAAGATAVGSVAGLSPAIIALVTLGACCSTSAAATAGITLIAHASGTTSYNLLANSWYLGVFQMGVLWVALIAQEQLIAVYGSLWGAETAPSRVSAPAMPPFSLRFVLGGVLRVALLVTAVLMALTMVAQWIDIPPLAAPAGGVGSWLFQHTFVALLIGAAALAPLGVSRLISWQGSSRWAPWLLRGLLLVGGLTLAIGLPPPLSSSGWYGLVNLLLGSAGAPASWGAVSSGGGLSLGLALRWGFEYLLLGGYAILLALRPRLALAPLHWTVARSPEAGPASAMASGSAPTQ